MRFSVPRGAVCAAILIVGFLLGHAWSAREPMARGERAADDPVKPVAAARPDNGTKAYSAPPDVHLHLLQSPGVRSQRPPSDYGLGPNHVSKLPPYPPGGAGVRTPFDLWRYAGKQGGSIGNPRLPMTFEEWLSFHREQKPQLMEAVRQYMNGRFDFSGDALPGATMSGGKPIMKGPIARLPEGVESWESLSAMTPEQIREKDIFPYTPLAHPLHTTAHMLFPGNWVRAHPEHRRIDVDFDIPEEYLPEFPPPLFLSTHKELGDVSGGVEITLGNYFETFDGLLTGEQLEGAQRARSSGPVRIHQGQRRALLIGCAPGSQR